MDQYVLDEWQRAQVEEWLCGRQGGIRDVLSCLSYNPRRLLQLRYGLADGHRYSIEEIAEVFQKPPKWVMDVESDAISQVYQFLAPSGGFDSQLLRRLSPR